MSGAQFTKGPWEPRSRTAFGNNEIAVEPIAADVNDGRVVALCYGTDRDANANLIAAAPDYDAFVVEALPQLEVLHSTLPQGEARAAVWRVILKGRAALAKARGKTA